MARSSSHLDCRIVAHQFLPGNPLMRKGYWLTLLRRLRDRVSAGDNAFKHQSGWVIIAKVLGTEDAPLAHVSELPFAEDAQGRILLLEIDSARVVMQHTQTDTREIISDNFADFVSTLRSLAPVGLELGGVVGDDMIDIAAPRRGLWDDDSM